MINLELLDLNAQIRSVYINQVYQLFRQLSDEYADIKESYLSLADFMKQSRDSDLVTEEILLHVKESMEHVRACSQHVKRVSEDIDLCLENLLQCLMSVDAVLHLDMDHDPLAARFGSDFGDNAKRFTVL